MLLIWFTAVVVSKAQTVMSYGSKRVALAEDIFVAPSATVLGDVKIGKGSSVWYGAVLRGALCDNQALLRVVFFPPRC